MRKRASTGKKGDQPPHPNVVRGRKDRSEETGDLWDLLQPRLWSACSREVLSSVTKGLAHDLNNLLTGVYTVSDFCLRDLPVNDTMRESLELIRANGNRAAELVRTLFQIHEAQIGNTALHDLNALAQECLTLIRAATSRSIGIELVLASEPLPVMVDGIAFRTVLLHLAANGAEAIAGKGVMQVRTSVVHQSKAVKGKGKNNDHNLGSGLAVGDWACLEFRDSGVGMDRALFRKIGDPRFTTKPANGGIGLGLYLVREFARSSRGGFRLESEPGAGTSVKVFLPMATFAEEPTATTAPVPLGRKKAEHGRTSRAGEK